MKVFVDTNILIDLVCERQPFVEAARRLFAMGYQGRAQLMVSALSIVNTIYIGNSITMKTSNNNLYESPVL